MNLPRRHPSRSFFCVCASLAVSSSCVFAFTTLPPPAYVHLPHRATGSRLCVSTPSQPPTYSSGHQLTDLEQDVQVLTDYNSAAVATEALEIASTQLPESNESPNATSQPTESTPRTLYIRRPTMVKSLSFLAAVSDVICRHRHGCFANMMTGNTISMATAMTGPSWIELAFFGCLLSSYMVGFGAYRALDLAVQSHQQRRRQLDKLQENQLQTEKQRRLVTPAVTAPIVLGIFALYDMIFKHTSARWAVLLLSIGSALVNAAGLESTSAVTCMMTGNLQKIANYLTDSTLNKLLGSPKAVSAELRKGARKSCKIVGSFVAGIALTTAAMRWGGLLLTKGLGLDGSVVLGIAKLPHFTIIGGVYALLLTLYSQSIAGVRHADRPSSIQIMREAASRVWRRRKVGDDDGASSLEVNIEGVEEEFADDVVIDPCVMDIHETECVSANQECVLNTATFANGTVAIPDISVASSSLQ